MEFWDAMQLGLATALQPMNLLYCFIGVFIGTLVGVLPGIGPVGAMSLLLPATFSISPAGAIIMLSGIFYGAQYGGGNPPPFVNIPRGRYFLFPRLGGWQNPT